jgi:hypothetical protein
MHNDLPYPSSFPNAVEERFIQLILSSDSDFPDLFDSWKRDTVFDNIDAAAFGLLPLLYLRLSALGIEDDHVTGRIRGVYKLTWFRNQRLVQDVRKMALLCHDAGIPIMLLKGLALVLNVYRDPAARALADGDLLVHPQNVASVFGLLKNQNWKQVDDLRRRSDICIPSADEFTDTRPDRRGHSATFMNDADNMIDLHWQVFHTRLNQSAIRLLLLRKLPVWNTRSKLSAHHWKNALSTTIKGVPCQMLSLEDMLVHVVVHGAGENVHRPLRWVVDVAHIIRTGKIDWDKLIESTRISGNEVEMFIAFRYLIERQLVSVPDSFWNKLKRMRLSRRAIRQYYKRWDFWRILLGDFPSHWYRYWIYESKGSFLERCYALPAYLRELWGVEEKKSLTYFIFEKYRVRLMRNQEPIGRS